MKNLRAYTITKKIAKHGKQAVIVIPKVLAEELKPDTLVEISIQVLKEAKEKNELNN